MKDRWRCFGSWICRGGGMDYYFKSWAQSWPGHGFPPHSELSSVWSHLNNSRRGPTRPFIQHLCGPFWGLYPPYKAEIKKSKRVVFFIQRLTQAVWIHPFVVNEWMNITYLPSELDAIRADGFVQQTRVGILLHSFTFCHAEFNLLDGEIWTKKIYS